MGGRETARPRRDGGGDGEKREAELGEGPEMQTLGQPATLSAVLVASWAFGARWTNKAEVLGLLGFLSGLSCRVEMYRLGLDFLGSCTDLGCLKKGTDLGSLLQKENGNTYRTSFVTEPAYVVNGQDRKQHLYGLKRAKKNVAVE
jgi:hypothetical protein